MLSLRQAIVFAAATALCGRLWGAPTAQEPYVGYVYPAGGQQGSVFRVTVAGQRLGRVDAVHISGKGVRASVSGYVGAGGPLNRLQQDILKQRLQEIRDKHWPQFRAGGNPSAKPQKTPAKPDATTTANPDTPKAELPDLPDLRNLEQKTPIQLRQIADKYLNVAKRPKPPIAEELTLEVTIDPNATPGDRELRLQAPNGLSNPLVFQVGAVPEIREPGRYEEQDGLPASVKPPVVLNGQILPGEVDRFTVQLEQSRQVIIAVQARKLIPYLADAVPGWFQAVVALYDMHGKEITFADDCGFDPDPALVFQVPQDGIYTVEIRDALYRGREDFVYRAVIGDESAVRAFIPSGSRGGIAIASSPALRETAIRQAVEYLQPSDKSITQCQEKEPNDTGKTSTRLKLPQIIRGCIATPGDKDVFQFEGHAGDTVVAEVYARRMGSPVDSLLRIMNASGQVVAWNDDNKSLESGLLTHHADSWISTRLPSTGCYYVQISDARSHGGPQFDYCLRISPPQPDFALRVTPSSLSVPSGRAVPVTVYAMRKDGWDGDIEVALKDASAGFALSGARIPKGRDKIRMTLIAPNQFVNQLATIELEGRAQIGGKTIIRPAVPCEDKMQAFAYHHLVPSGQLAVMTVRRGLVQLHLEAESGERLKIPTGGSAQITFTIRPIMRNSASIRLEISEPPAGVTLQDVKITPGKLTLTIKADDKHTRYMDNLIFEAFTEVELPGKKGPAGQKQRVSLGVLPAIPFEIVKP